MIFGAVLFLLPSMAIAQLRPTTEEAKLRVMATFGPPTGFTQLSKRGLVWINPAKGMLVCDGYVALRSGQLEMFACQVGTKEHESIVAVFAQASNVHGGLLAIGAEAGSPVQFEPFQPATGTKIKIDLLWYDPEGKKHSSPAQKWVQNVETKEHLKLDWVFAGSAWVTSSYDQKDYYLADNGDFITVANFPGATLDLSVRSDASNANLLFEPSTDAIPPLYTPVRMLLRLVE